MSRKPPPTGTLSERAMRVMQDRHSRFGPVPDRSPAARAFWQAMAGFQPIRDASGNIDRAATDAAWAARVAEAGFSSAEDPGGWPALVAERKR
jgi:hypothetical protein